MDTPELSRRYGSGYVGRNFFFVSYVLFYIRYLQSKSLRGHLAAASSHPKWRRLQKGCYDLRMTIICGFITLLVLRGTMGAGKFGTPFQDAILQSPDRTSKSGNPSVIADSLLNESLPYVIGPKLRDWDKQRRSFRESTKVEGTKRKLKVMMVTSSRGVSCDQAVGDHLLLKALKNKIDYGRLKGIEVFFNLADMDPRMVGSWAKLPILRRLMLNRVDIDWFWWIEPDAFISDMSFSIPFAKYKRHSLVIHGWNDLVYEKKDWVGLSTGSFLIRNCQWSLDLIDAWHVMGPSPEIRVKAGKLLSLSLSGRPNLEADDQSALIYLINQNKAKWGPLIFLENDYRLYGLWSQITQRYEKIALNGSRGTGDDRWPFVTHFLGCKSCNGFGRSNLLQCVEQMNRAFNFGDNQVLSQYGFQHSSLQSNVVQRMNSRGDLVFRKP